jgi:RHS repeat-associated protein
LIKLGISLVTKDSATGLDYHRARYYDPGLGRFVSKDDYSGRLNSPITQNPYAYANANPVSFTDPSGYFSLGEVNAAEAISGILSSIPALALRTVGAIIGGALAAGVFDTARQGYQLIDSAIHGDGRKTDFNVDELLQSIQVGAVLGPLFAVVPEAALYFAYEGIKSGLNEIKAGNVATGIFDILTSVIPLVDQIGSKGGSQCFVARTKILTTEGEKNIEDIRVGDWVVSDDPNTSGGIEAKQVSDTFVRHATTLVDIYIDGEKISTTGEHPFWTPDHGWVESKDLEVGSLLQTEDGRIIDVDKIEKREGDFTVYNFKVEGFHTYFVSDLGILVHNANCNSFGGLEPEDIFIREFPTSQEPLTFRGEIEIDGKTLHLKDIGIFPSESRRINATQTELRSIFSELQQQAINEGFEKLRITGRRSSGATFDPNNINSGKRFDITFDLTE